VGFTVLKLLGARLVSGTVNNPLFASIALVVGLLVWLNLIARLTLIAAAWAANDVGAREMAGVPVGPATPRIPLERSASLPTFGARAADRTTLAAGAVLGATGAMALGSLVRGLGGLLRRER